MTQQELIDKITEIRDMVQDVEGLDKEDESLLVRIANTCNNILTDWKVEQRLAANEYEALKYE